MLWHLCHFETNSNRIFIRICWCHIIVNLDSTHWGRATHICGSKPTIIASDNGLSPGRRQAIIWNNAGILSIGFLRTNFSEISIEILTFSFKKMHLKGSSANWRPFCLGLNVLTASMLLLLCINPAWYSWWDFTTALHSKARFIPVIHSSLTRMQIWIQIEIYISLISKHYTIY